MILTRVIYNKRIKEGRLGKLRRNLTFFGLIVFFFIVGAVGYFGTYIHATERALTFMGSTETVKVSEIDEGYFFDGPGTENAYIFYPGAKVDEKAYAELMQMIADDGTDCFLVKMPFHFAFFGVGRAGSIIDKYKYDSWYIGGHSLGGAMACNFAAENEDRLKGGVFLAAYSNEKIDDSFGAVSVTATNDKILDWKKYNESMMYYPAGIKEVSIEGGNHSQFGDYGMQGGDGEATISLDEQMRLTADAVKVLVG